MAEIDAYCSLAETSRMPNMVKPTVHPMDREPFLKIMQMRHPLLEMKNLNFVANDIVMNFND